MKLEAAIRSGTGFKRPHHTSFYSSVGEMIDDGVFEDADVIADDYVLDGSALSLSTTDLAKAWDAVISTGGYNMKTAATSKFFKALSTYLKDEYGTSTTV